MSKFMDVEPALAEMRARVNSPSDARNHAEGWMAGFMAAEQILLKHVRRSDWAAPIYHEFPGPTDEELARYGQERNGTYSIRESFGGPNWREKIGEPEFEVTSAERLIKHIEKVKETIKEVALETAIPAQVIEYPSITAHMYLPETVEPRPIQARVIDTDLVNCDFCGERLNRGDAVAFGKEGELRKAHYRCYAERDKS